MTTYVYRVTSRRLLAVAGLIELTAPVAAAAVVLFGGTAIGSCGATIGDGGLRPACPVQVAVWPPLRTNDGIAISLAACVLSWLIASYVLIAHVDRRRLLRLAAGIGLAVILTASMGFAWGLRQRLLYAAQDAVTWGIAGLVLGLILGLAWLGLPPGTNGARLTPNSTGRP